jgi:hypothetical protein
MVPLDILTSVEFYLYQHLFDLISGIVIALISGIVSGLLVIYIQNRLTKHLTVCKSMPAYHGIFHPRKGRDWWIQISICNNGKAKIDYLNIIFKVKAPAEFGVIKADERVPANVEYSNTSGRLRLRNTIEKEKVIKIKNIFPESSMAFMFQIFNIEHPNDVKIEFHSEVNPEVVDLLSNDLYWTTGRLYKNSKTTKGRILNKMWEFRPHGYALKEGDLNPLSWEGTYPDFED